MFDKNEDTCWNSDQVCVVYIAFLSMDGFHSDVIKL